MTLLSFFATKEDSRQYICLDIKKMFIDSKQYIQPLKHFVVFYLNTYTYDKIDKFNGMRVIYTCTL